MLIVIGQQKDQSPAFPRDPWVEAREIGEVTALVVVAADAIVDASHVPTYAYWSRLANPMPAGEHELRVCVPITSESRRKSGIHSILRVHLLRQG